MIRRALAAGILVGALVRAPLAGQTPAGGAAQPEVSGRYRVMITGFAARRGTVDDPRDYDGVKDEVFSAVAAVLWDRTTMSVTSRNVARTREYGDVGNAGQRGTRLQAGSATVAGGIRSNDIIPKEYDPLGTALPAPAADQLPLLVWEGVLTDSIDGLLVVPSLWESDLRSRGYENYETTWSTAPLGLLNTALVQGQLVTPTVGVLTGSRGVAPSVANSLTTAFTGDVIGTFGIISALATANLDRPIGLEPAGAAMTYHDRLVVITHEKIRALQPGEGLTLEIPFMEPADGVLGGSYLLYLRVERLS